MQRPANPFADHERFERVVTRVVVGAVAVAAVGAAVMQPRRDAAWERAQPAAPAPAHPCAACGTVEAVTALAAPASDGGYQMRIRMDDGTLRTVEQPSALATGSRVMLAGGAARPLGRRG